MSRILVGVNVSAEITPGRDPVAEARRAEEVGFDFVSSFDHLHGEQPTYEPWTLLSWIAAATSAIRVATRVLAVPYRHPPVLAKMAETLDRLSGGRLILGLGAGYVDEEFRAFGLGTRTPGEKIAGLEEAIRIIQGVWSEERLTFEGRLYRTDGADVRPKPEHRIPIWLGTYGPRALEVTGRLADGWIPTLELAPPDRVVAMRERVLDAARDAGRSPEDILCVYNVGIRVDEDAEPAPGVVSGQPEAVADQLLQLTRLGFGAFNLLPSGPALENQVERIGREVLPALRSAV
ncbi:MAG TPA: LLM class flavin-dependent oxidoreductase [Actinomycetota bacterium]|jgi:probable F420-dependent oxidoreductase